MGKTFCTFAEFQAMKPQERGETIAQLLSSFVNGAGEEEKRAFVEKVLCDHRTLQQEIFDLFLRTCEKWAQVEENWYDLRNEFTVKTSKKIVEEVLEGCARAPYI